MIRRRFVNVDEFLLWVARPAISNLVLRNSFLDHNQILCNQSLWLRQRQFPIAGKTSLCLFKSTQAGEIQSLAETTTLEEFSSLLCSRFSISDFDPTKLVETTAFSVFRQTFSLSDDIQVEIDTIPFQGKGLYSIGSWIETKGVTQSTLFDFDFKWTDEATEFALEQHLAEIEPFPQSKIPWLHKSIQDLLFQFQVSLTTLPNPKSQARIFTAILDDFNPFFSKIPHIKEEEVQSGL